MFVLFIQIIWLTYILQYNIGQRTRGVGSKLGLQVHRSIPNFWTTIQAAVPFLRHQFFFLIPSVRQQRGSFDGLLNRIFAPIGIFAGSQCFQITERRPPRVDCKSRTERQHRQQPFSCFHRSPLNSFITTGHDIPMKMYTAIDTPSSHIGLCKRNAKSDQRHIYIMVLQSKSSDSLQRSRFKLLIE